MLPSARLGDIHACPVPGHGITPITSASENISINAMGAARVGDVCGCGAVITTGFPSILLNGRPMAHAGSLTSHGGTLITGSDNTFGGFVIGNAGGATVINFMALGAFRPDGSVDDQKMAALLADPKLAEKAAAANALVSPGTAINEPEQKVCNHPDMMEELAAYIAGEMNTNIHHSSVLKMKDLLSYDVAEETRKQMELPWYAQIGMTSAQTIGAAKGVAAMAIWTERVGQNRPWDHKPTIHQKFGDYYHKQGNYDYFYDIWSNIHYSYVGRAGGLSESVLSDGAGVEQIASNSIRKILDWDEQRGPYASKDVTGLRAYDDDQDRISISIGIKLFAEHPDGGITPQMIMEKVLAVKPEDWGDGARAHICKNA